MPNKQPNDIHLGLQRAEASQAQKQTRTEMTEMANKKLICRVNQNWFFKNTNKANKPLAKLTQRKRQKTQDTIMREERGGATSDANEIQSIVRKYFEHLDPQTSKKL